MKKKVITLLEWALAIIIIVFVYSRIPETKLSGPKNPQIGDVIGSKEIIIFDHEKVNGIDRKIPGTNRIAIKYAYIKGEIPVSDFAVEKQAQKNHLQITGENIGKRTEKARIFETDKPNTFILLAFSGNPQFYKDDNGKWWQASYATISPAEFPSLPQVPVRASWFPKALAVNFFPKAGTGTNDIDCQLRYTAAGSWATAHDATDGNADDTDVTDLNNTSHLSGGQYYIDRSWVNFDTSSIGAGSTVTSATFNMYSASPDNADTTYVGLVTNSISSTSCLQADFDLFGTTKQATDINLSAIIAAQYNAFTLNATGLSNISLTGITKFATRIGRDIDNSAPTGLNGTSYRSGDWTPDPDQFAPKLSVTFTAAVTSDSGEGVIFPLF